MEPNILVDQPAEGVTRITLNRPAARNAFTYAMYDELLQILEGIASDMSIRAVILTGAGSAFCTGHDLRSAGTNPHVPEGLGPLYAGKVAMSRLARIPIALRGLPQPVIAALNGTVAGIGYVLALASDMAIAAQSAKFVNAVHNAGSGHELGMSYMLSHQVGSQQAAELLYTARAVSAEEAARIGLVLRAVPDETLLDEALEIASAIAANVPMGIWLTKQSLWHNQNVGSLEAAIEMEMRAVQIAQGTADAIEKRTSFIEKRPPRFDLS
jgi:enoyl-CoA hydratase